MLRSTLGLSCLLPLLTCAAVAGPLIDGSATDPLYGPPLVVQDTQTGFGDSSLGRPDLANGSELDAAYGVVYNGTLYLVLAGNFETNGNKLEIFFDSRAGGQNQLLATNPTSAGLDRMKAGTEGPGLKFAAGFEADFYISVNAFGDPASVYVDYAELYVDALNPGVAYFAGAGLTTCATDNGALTDGDEGAPVIRATIDNSNTLGVDGGFGTSDGSGVLTGLELAIPLSALGNPTGHIRICAFINGQQHDFLSNQVLGGLFGFVPDNLGEPRNVDFSTTLHQPFVVPLFTTPVGACCIGGQCDIRTEADCLASGGTYLGDNADCQGNPCDGIPAGACCLAGECVILTEADCLAQGGAYLGDDTTCVNCPCPPLGACCLGSECVLLTEEQCDTAGGDYLGDYTTCAGSPCATGACCVAGECVEVREEQCNELQGRYLGDGTVCGPNTCNSGACCIDNLCFVVPEADCIALGGLYQRELTDCDGNPTATPEGLLTIDGLRKLPYGQPIVVQDTQTQFGNSDLGLIDRANGSELDAAYAYIGGGRLHLLITGNLESNFNKLEVFFDTLPGGQNRLLQDVNPPVDFNALGRLGDNGTGNGLTFDADFAPDFYLSLTGGNTPYEMFANFAELYDEFNAPTPAGYFLGRGRAADRTNGGLLDPVPGASNVPLVLATLNNSNTAGVVGGTSLIGPDEFPADVATGIEISIPLAAIGDPLDAFKVCVFVNGSGHDFMSNQVLGPIGGGGNFGEPRNVNFANVAGQQWFTVSLVSDPCAGQLRADTNCDGAVDTADIDSFVLAIVGGQTAWEALPSSGGCSFLCVADVNNDGAVDTADIDAFVAAVVGQ